MEKTFYRELVKWIIHIVFNMDEHNAYVNAYEGVCVYVCTYVCETHMLI